MILSLQTNTFGCYGGIPAYNRLVCRVLNNFDSTIQNQVLIAMDRPSDVDHATGLHPNLRLAGFGGNRINFVKAAWRAVVKSPVSVLLAGHLNYGPLCLLLKFFRPGLRFGVFIYGWEAWDRISPMRRWALQRANFIISISDYTKQEALRINRLREDQIFLLPNALEWAESAGASSRSPIALPQGMKILSVGRMDATERRKGFETVIRSLPAIAEKVPSVQYIVIGNGTDFDRHQELAAQVGVSDRVHFLGSLDERTLQFCYQACDVFAMPSSQEGFGFVYLEAMHYGKPVVAAKSGGAPEVVEHGVTGILVEYGNEGELIRAITDLCLNQEKREQMGRFGYRRLQENFTYTHFKDTLIDILSQQLSPERSSASTNSGVTLLNSHCNGKD